jgi:hypothetical protein
MSSLPWLWMAAGALAVVFAALERGVLRRIAAGALPLLVAALALPPRFPGRVREAGTLQSKASRAEVEATRDAVRPGGTITVTGDGLHPDYWSLLAGRRVAWRAPDARPGLVALSWPRRAWIGDPAVVRGATAKGDSVAVTLLGPGGERDSVTTDGDFAFVVVPRAEGPATWSVGVGGGSHDTLGTDVREPPRLRIVILAARPDFELPALARRLAAQGAAVVLQTRLTASDVRTVRYGAAPEGDPLAAGVLTTLDLLVLGDGVEPALSSAARERLITAVREGLGVVQVAGTIRERTALFPVETIALPGGVVSTAIRVDSVRLPGNIPVAPIALNGGDALATTAAGVAVASVVPVGRGQVVVSRVMAPSRWSLAGVPDAEARWWARVAGAALRRPRGEWVMSDSALVRVDEPVRVRWLGDTTGFTTLVEGGVTDTVAWASSDSLGGEIVLWPREAGWLTLARDQDTVRVMVGDADDHAAIAATARRRAAEAAIAAPAGDGPPAAPAPREFPHWPFAIGLLGTAALVWRRGSNAA